MPMLFCAKYIDIFVTISITHVHAVSREYNTDPKTYLHMHISNHNKQLNSYDNLSIYYLLWYTHTCSTRTTHILYLTTIYFKCAPQSQLSKQTVACMLGTTGAKSEQERHINNGNTPPPPPCVE